MSVVKSKRSEGKLRVVTKSAELAKYTINACSNEKYFPKKSRWCFVGKIVDSVIEVNSNILKANSIYVKNEEDFKLRRSYQNIALAELESLNGKIAIAYGAYGLPAKKVEYWNGLLEELKVMIVNWRKGDENKYKK